jgi:putative DNA primase/helicase
MKEIEDHIAPIDWKIDETGVWRTREVYKRGKLVDNYTEVASPIPVVPTSILKNVDTHTEKLELSFFKHNRWQNIVTERSVTANRNAIIKLADKGLEVNSDNATTLVKYIADVVAASLYCLPHKPAKSVMGWVDGEFMPYTDKVVFDGDDQFSTLYKSFQTKSTLDKWVEYVRPLRDSLDLRLCMAASFASPLIELIGENPFVFHLWGGTGSGKTVATMVAMSIWGDPAMGKLTRTMNMTANAMLSTAAFLRNLPFAGDELQTIKSRWQNYDNLIMKITEGIDRGRMSYDKVNETRAWKCSFIFTGEEPCIKQASGGGAKNRVIEVECKNKIIENGNQTANFVRTHYGTAGEPYIEQVKTAEVAKHYERIFTQIMSTTDTTEKQAGAMALMLTADRIASQLFWPDERPIGITEVQRYLASASEVDVVERAYQFVRNAIAENSANFHPDAQRTWGTIQGEHAYVNKNVLCRIMEEQGFDFDAVKTKWAERGYIELNSQGRYIHQRTINNVRASFVKVALLDSDYFGHNDEINDLPF